MTWTNYHSATANTDYDVASNNWISDPDNVHTDNTNNCRPNGAGAEWTWHTFRDGATSLDSSVPSGATVNGIEVGVRLYDSSVDDGTTIDVALILDRGTGTPPTITTIRNTGAVATTATMYTNASPATDLWGEASIAISDLEDANFAVYLGPGNGTWLTDIRCEFIRVRVDYTAAGGGGAALPRHPITPFRHNLMR